LKKIAEKYNKQAAQVLISWAAQRGTSVIPKSVQADRIKANFQDFILSEEDMKAIKELSEDKDKRKRICQPASFWKLDCFEDDHK